MSAEWWDTLAGWGVLFLLMIVYPVAGAIGEMKSEKAFRKAQNMFLSDGLGNSLDKDDLVIFTDNFGRTQLCFIVAIEPGAVQLQPLWIREPFDLKYPQVGRVIKVVKPPQFQEVPHAAKSRHQS